VGGATGISVLKGQGGAPSYIYGASTAWMKFPVGILPSVEYTLLHVARYNGNTKRFIFQGVNGLFAPGFYGGMSGVAHHSNLCFPMTQVTTDVHGSNWVVSADRSNSYRSNGVDRTTNGGCSQYDRLAINTGYFAASESSDFAIQTVLVYNRKLTDADVISLESWLTRCEGVFDISLGFATFMCVSKYSKRVTFSMFDILATNRIANKTNVSVSFSFTTSSGSSLAIGSFISLMYPSGFFSTFATPSVTMSGSFAGTSSTPSSSAIVITTATAVIPASTNVTVTLSGLRLGPITAGNISGITLSTSADFTPSVGLGSGAIGYAVLNTSFSVGSWDRIAGKSDCEATITFTPSVGGAVVAEGKITLMYPSGFFASGVTATQVALSGGPTVASAAPSTATSIVVTLLSGMLVPSTAVTMRLSGLTMGVANGGSGSGITVSTSADLIPSVGTASGFIVDPVPWCGT